jgi:hypothetical protein
MLNGPAVGWSIVSEERSLAFHEQLMTALGAEVDPELAADYPELHMVTLGVVGSVEELRSAARAVPGWDALVGIAPYGKASMAGLRTAVGWRAWLALKLTQGFPQDGIWKLLVFDDGVLVDSILAQARLQSASFVVRRAD